MGTGRLGCSTARRRKRACMAGGTPICVHMPCSCSLVMAAGAASSDRPPGDGGGKPKDSTLGRAAPSMLLLAPRPCAGSCSMAKLERPLVCSECADSVLPRPVGVAAMPRPPLVRSRTSVELRQPERRPKVLELRRPPGPEPVLMVALMLRLLPPPPCTMAES